MLIKNRDQFVLVVYLFTTHSAEDLDKGVNVAQDVITQAPLGFWQV